MCGISGFIGRKKIEEGVISATLDKMKRRGPDNQDYVHLSAGEQNIYLLHSRLSIIDLDPRSNQPFTIGDYTLLYNGELYNYVELRNQMTKSGETFKTESDTEVLLRYYIKYGERCLEHFEGMWSFAIYNQKNATLFLSRDRFAEKPLYYYQTSDGFYFGSEIKLLKSLSQDNLSINYKHVERYLVNGYKSLYKSDQTFFENVYELPPFHNATVSAEGELVLSAYWQPEYSPREMTLNQAIEGTREHLLESMRIRLRSDVPLAFCLSGGVDSAGLASIAAKEFNYDVSTFSIIDPDVRYNEAENIKATIEDLGCKHTLIELKQENMLSRLEKLVEYHDTPLGTVSYLVHSMLSERMHQDGYKVAFSGTAADEIFTGYYDHFNLHLYEMKDHPDYDKYLKSWNEHLGGLIRNPYLKNPELYLMDKTERGHIYLNNEVFSSYMLSGFSEQFSESDYNSSLLRNRMLNELFHETNRVILHEDDLNSMMYSIENRSPYLDSRLVEFGYSIPSKYLIQDGFGKFVLRQALKGYLNDQVRLDRRKVGFNASLNSIFDFESDKDRDYLLAESPIFDVVDKKKVKEVMKMKDLPNSFNKFVFNFINAKIFLELN